MAARKRVWRNIRLVPRSDSAFGSCSSTSRRSNVSMDRCRRWSSSYSPRNSLTSPGLNRKGGSMPEASASSAAARPHTNRSIGPSNGGGASARRCSSAYSSSRVSNSGSTWAVPASRVRCSSVHRSWSAAACDGTMTADARRSQALVSATHENRPAKGRQIRGAEQPLLSGRDHVLLEGADRERIRTQRGPLSECTSFHRPRRYGPSGRAVSQPVENMWTACGSPVDRQGAQNFSPPAPRRRRRDRPPCAPVFALSFAVADTCQVTRIPLVLVAIINPTPAR